MQEQITVEKALQNGKVTILYPMIIFLVGCPILSLVFLNRFENQIIDGLWFPMALWIGIIVGIISAKLYWSFRSLKWQFWAFENVRNVNELKTKAFQNKLISEKNFILKRKFKTKDYDRQKILDRIKKKFEEKDIYRDSFDVPNETIIKELLFWKLFFLIFSLCLLGLSITIIFKVENYKFYYLIPLLLGFSFSYIAIKSFFDKEPAIILNSIGIKFAKKNFMEWQFINDEHIEVENKGEYKSYYISLFYQNKTYKIMIGSSLSKKPKEIENLLRVYRVRFEKNKPN
jgi:hypothetical protein